MVYETFSEKETIELAKKMGREAQSGEVYCLEGDL